MAVAPGELDDKTLLEYENELERLNNQISSITEEYASEKFIGSNAPIERDLKETHREQREEMFREYATGLMNLNKRRKVVFAAIQTHNKAVRARLESEKTELKRQLEAQTAKPADVKSAVESRRGRVEGTRDQGVQVGGPGEAGSPVKGAHVDKSGVQAPDAEKKEDDELVRVRREKEKLSADVNALTAELDALKSTLEKALSKNKEQDVALLEANNHITQLVEDTRVGFDNMKREHEEQIRIKENSIRAIEGRITALQEEHKTTIDDLKGEHKRAIEEKDADIKALEQERDKFKGELDTVQEALRRLTAENDKNKSELDSAQRAVTALQTETASLKATNATLTTQITTLEDQAKLGEGVNEKLKEAIAKLKEQFEQFEKDAKKAYDDSQTAFQKIREELERRIAEQTNQIRALQEANQTLNVEKNALNERATRAEQLINMGKGGTGPGGRKLR